MSNSFDILHKLLNLNVQSFLSFLLHLIELGCIFVTIGSDNSSGDSLPVYNSSKGETEENKEKMGDELPSSVYDDTTTAMGPGNPAHLFPNKEKRGRSSPQ